MKFSTASNSNGDLMVVAHDATINDITHIMGYMGYSVFDVSTLNPLPTFIDASKHYFVHDRFSMASFDGTLIEALGRDAQLYLQSIVDDQLTQDITIECGPDMRIYPNSWVEDVSYDDLVNDTY
jgi:hypothetical protein